MTNRDRFELFAMHDLKMVTDCVAKGYTETSEFKVRVENLVNSLSAMLQDMDVSEEKVGA